MRFAFQSSPRPGEWSSLQELFVRADDLCVFESGFVADHFRPSTYDETGRPLDADGEQLEGWTMTAALLQVTERLRIGPLVTCVAFRNIGLLAKIIATADLISGGRVAVALGAGWNVPESEAYGIHLGELRTRLDRLEESIAVLHRLLTEDQVDHDGTFWTLRGARVDPKCAQRPRPPFIIGGRGQQRTVEIAVKFADCWNVPPIPPGQIKEKAEALQRCCDRLGRDRDTITFATQIRVTPDASAADIADRVRGLRRVGADMAVLLLPDPSHQLGSLEQVAAVLEPLA